MSRAESGESHGQEEFSIEGEKIGGPKEYWKRITTEGGKELPAWEFINQESPKGKLDGYTFRFPQESLADIYIQDSGEEKVFTAMGKAGVSLDSHFEVSKIQLYLHSRKFEENYQGQWVEVIWEDNGTSFKRTNDWYPIGMTTHPRVEMPKNTDIPKDDSPSWTEKPKNKPKHILKWVLAGVLTIGGVSILNSFTYPLFNNAPENSNNSNNNSQQTEVPIPTPIVTTEPTITPEITTDPNIPQITFDTYDLKFGDTWIAPAYSIVAIPPESGIVVGPPAAANRVQLNFLKVNENSWGAYDYIAIGVEDTPLMISTPSDPKFYTRDIIVKYNLRTPDLQRPGAVLQTDSYEMEMLGTHNILSTDYQLPQSGTLDRNLCGLPFISCSIVK